MSRMKNTGNLFLFVVLLSFVTAVLGAEDGRPCLKGSTDKNPLSYRLGEEMTFTLRLERAEALPRGLEVSWTRTGDDGKTMSGRIPADPERPLVLKTSIDRPGFVRIFAVLRRSDGDVWMPDGRPPKKDRAGELPGAVFFDGGAGADVAAIRQGVAAPPDFDAFWSRHKAVLAAVPMAGATCVELPSANPVVKVFAVSVPCAGPRPSTGYLVVPAKTGKYPAEMHFHGYETSWSKSATNPPDVSKEKGDVLKFILSAHGFELNRDDAYYKAVREKSSSNGYGHAFDPAQNANPETAYFCGMTYRVMRGVEYVKSRPEWNGRNLTVAGSSQGGLQSIWAAALVPGVTEARVSVPWCCDIGGTEVARNRGAWFVEWVPALGFYDLVNMARRIPPSCRVDVVRAGLGDYTCPPSGVAAFYNNLTCPKSIVWVQGSTHGYVPPAHEAFRFEASAKSPQPAAR